MDEREKSSLHSVWMEVLEIDGEKPGLSVHVLSSWSTISVVDIEKTKLILAVIFLRNCTQYSTDYLDISVNVTRVHCLKNRTFKISLFIETVCRFSDLLIWAFFLHESTIHIKLNTASNLSIAD
jgi:hypothetical protein